MISDAHRRVLVAQALHEAVAHQGRIARWLDLSRLVVDLGGQQHRAAGSTWVRDEAHFEELIGNDRLVARLAHQPPGRVGTVG